MTNLRWMQHFAFAAAVASITALPVAAQSTFEGGATVTGPNGLTTEVNRSGSAQNGNASGTVSVQREDGRGWNRDWSRTRENGVVRRESTHTNNNGQTWTRQGDRTCSGGNCTGSSVVTGPNDRTYSRESQWQRTGRGQWEGNVTRTGPRGRTTNSRRWFQIRRN